MNWISVKDRLPEKQTAVLVSLNEDGQQRTAVHWLYNSLLLSPTVTHWMPLPEPPSPPDPFEEWWNSRPNRECMAQLIDKMAANVVWDAALASTKK